MTHNNDANNGSRTRSQGVRKSNFPGQSTIPSDAFFDFTSAGHNVKISVSDMIDAFGTTGSIGQVGDPSCVPILDDQGSFKGIRNLEAGFGIAIIIVPNECIEISTDFTFNDEGVALVDDPDASSAVFRSLFPGTGISIAESDGQIQISVTGAPTSTKTVLISQKSDLPTPVSGVITLSDDTEYRFLDDVDIGTDRLVFGSGTALTGSGSSIIALTYTGTGDMLTSVDNSCRADKLTINFPNGRMINMSDTTFDHIFQLNDCTVAGKDVALFTDVGAVQYLNTLFRVTGLGTLWAGSDGGAFVSDLCIGIMTGTNPLYDLTGATIGSWTNESSLYQLIGVGSSLLKGDAGSINITSLGTLTNARIEGVGTPLIGITEDDNRWQFFLNDTISDTRTDGLLSMQGNAVATNNSAVAIGEPVLVAGAWVVEAESQMTGTVAGRLTLDTVKDTRLPIGATLTVAPASGGSQSISVYVAVNGSFVANSQRTATASPGTPTSITVLWQEDLSPTNFVEIFVANDSAATDVLVSSAIHRVN